MSDIPIPERLATNCRKTMEGIDWLAQLPSAILDLRQWWSLTLGPPVDEEASCS
jgi:hypothetical protein